MDINGPGSVEGRQTTYSNEVWLIWGFKIFVLFLFLVIPLNHIGHDKSDR